MGGMNDSSSASDTTSSPPPRRGRFLDAARGEGQGRPPIWIMRQAGRYLPQYREIRSRHSFVEMCTRPELAVELSLQPWREFEMDAVVVFYDILFLPEAMGAPLEYTERGPVFDHPVRSADDVRGLRMPGPRGGAGPVVETLGRLREELPAEVAVLGFAGAPFTLAAYLVEGSFRRSGDRIRRLRHEDPDTLRELLDLLTAATIQYVEEQARGGADAIQLFDTWAGLLSVEDYTAFALPSQKRIFEALRALDVPCILYVNGCAHILEAMALSGAGVLSIDWRVSLPEARRRVGPRIGLQGNLDPASLFGAPEEAARRTREILESVAGDPAFLFNLGHGILPETPVESVRAVVETVRAVAPRGGSTDAPS